MNFTNKLNDTLTSLDKLDNLITNDNDKGQLRKHLLSMSDDLAKYRDIHEKNAIFDYKKISYDGDTLILDINTQKSGWVSFIDTWDHNWIVEVNDKPKKINKLFGAYKSVKIESGFSTVKFSYKPFNLNFTKD